MRFTINTDLLAQVRTTLIRWNRLYWVVGGSGSGKTTICGDLGARYGLPIYDMDAHIYGSYHGRFVPERHPVNTAWSTANDGLAWLLAMSLDEFDGFNRAALPEYVELLCEDLDTMDPRTGVLIDGGICNPALVAQVIPPRRIVCLASPEQTSAEIWEGSDERIAMKEIVEQTTQGAEAWRKFLEFDEQITRTIMHECRESGITICVRDRSMPIDAFAGMVAQMLALD